MLERVPARLEEGRILSGPMGGTAADRFNGAFIVQGPCGAALRIVASMADSSPKSEGWEHVSVSLPKRCPNWPELCFVKDLFWDPEETVIQLHPPRSQWISNHPFCLHLWRDTRNGHRLPPAILVGIQQAGEIKSVQQAMRVIREHGL